MSGTTVFMLKTCTDSRKQKNWFAICPVENPGYFLRCINRLLCSANGTVCPDFLAMDSAFILHQDKFHPGYFALQTAHMLPNVWYVQAPADGQVKLSYDQDTPKFRDEASFRIVEV